MVGGLLSGVKTIWTDVTTFFGGIPGDIVGIFKDADQWLIGAGKDVLRGLANGLVTTAEDTVGHIPIIGPRIVNEFKKALGVSSPSTIFAEIGRNVMQGFAIGVKTAQHRSPWPALPR